MSGRGYVPDAGDVVWLTVDPSAGDPHAGHEPAGHRPALVLSPASYNGRAGLMLCCPVTTRIKGYPFEVLLAGEPARVALADQVKSLEWRARGAVRKGGVSGGEIAAVRGKLRALVG